MFDLAFKSSEDTRLYRIGIATHAYADTWAHQNFVGWYDFFNDISLDVKPDIGHANAEHHPDWPAHRWEDSRLINDQVDNADRFFAAAKEMYGKTLSIHDDLIIKYFECCTDVPMAEVKELEKADSVFMTNSLVHIKAINEFQDFRYDINHPTVILLKKELDKFKRDPKNY